MFEVEEGVDVGALLVLEGIEDVGVAFAAVAGGDEGGGLDLEGGEVDLLEDLWGEVVFEEVVGDVGLAEVVLEVA